MRRLARGVTSESHPLYGEFLRKLSYCIFEWDSEDVDRLKVAQCEVLKQAGITNPTSTAIKRSLTKSDLLNHCKCRTRGTGETIANIESLILSLSSATDVLGVPLFWEEITTIWDEQKHHVQCLQDPTGIPLYTQTGHIQKGGVHLPTYRCARVSTSLESFHLHLARWIKNF